MIDLLYNIGAVFILLLPASFVFTLLMIMVGMRIYKYFRKKRLKKALTKGNVVYLDILRKLNDED